MKIRHDLLKDKTEPAIIIFLQSFWQIKRAFSCTLHTRKVQNEIAYKGAKNLEQFVLQEKLDSSSSSSSKFLQFECARTGDERVITFRQTGENGFRAIRFFFVF